MGLSEDQSIVFDQVSFAYAQGSPVLQDISLEIPFGQFVAILGANGSGKSTMAKHVNALLTPTSGDVRVGGYSTQDDAHIFGIRRHAGMVFQNPDNQAVASVVEDDVAFGPENLGLPLQEIRTRVHDALECVHMLDHAKDEIHSLSGGQKQRVAIAGVLAMNPDILILDEPGAMLDMRGRRGITRVAHELNDQGMTVLLITHFMEEALGADRVIVLDHGRVALDGAPAEVFTDAQRLRDLRLELPFALRVAHELQQRGVDVGAHLDEEELADELAAKLQAAGERASSKYAGERTDAAQHCVSEGAGQKAGTDEDDSCSFGETGAAHVAFSDVGYSYDAERLAIKDIDFSLEPGAFVGLIGHTGSGKSTITQLMNALLVPTEGEVVVGGLQTADKKNHRKIRERVGLVFQYPEQQLFASTIAEDVAFGPRNLGLSAQEVDQRSRSALEKLGLSYDSYAQRSPFDLSGGQRRRVALAGILAMEPRVLVLDEPAAGMDPATNAQIKGYLKAFNAEGMTVVLVSHSMDDIAELCDWVICMDKGSMFLTGTPEEVFSAENAAELRRINLGVPRATKFAFGLANRGAALPKPVLTVEQLVEQLEAALR